MLSPTILDAIRLVIKDYISYKRLIEPADPFYVRNSAQAPQIWPQRKLCSCKPALVGVCIED